MKEGQEVDVIVISMSKEERHLGLSIRRLNDKSKKAPKKSEVQEPAVESSSTCPDLRRS